MRSRSSGLIRQAASGVRPGCKEIRFPWRLKKSLGPLLDRQEARSLSIWVMQGPDKFDYIDELDVHGITSAKGILKRIGGAKKTKKMKNTGGVDQAYWLNNKKGSYRATCQYKDRDSNVIELTPPMLKVK